MKRYLYIISFSIFLSSLIIGGYLFLSQDRAQDASVASSTSTNSLTIYPQQNYFVNLLGVTDVQVNDKINNAWNKYFVNGDAGNEKLYYEKGADMAYILDVANNDVRSEGISYGMMIAVQLDKKAEFDKLWNFARTYMWNNPDSSNQDEKQQAGYFAWQVDTNGNKLDVNPASDGDEYIAMSLIFASKRWGNGIGIYNYEQEAQNLLDAMLHQADDGVGTNMFNLNQNLVVFTPIGTAAEFTDPSYNTPAFYELWARFDKDESDRLKWKEITTSSRNLLDNATNPQTGLSPDYAEFTGAPKYGWGGHEHFKFDAWRTVQNIAVDYSWFQLDSRAPQHARVLRDFFQSKGIQNYPSGYTIDGQALSDMQFHSPGLVAMNATSALADSTTNATQFVQELWNLSQPTGTYRYYDGMLYMLGLLKVSGKYQPIGFESTTPPQEPTPVDEKKSIQLVKLEETIDEDIQSYQVKIVSSQAIETDTKVTFRLIQGTAKERFDYVSPSPLEIVMPAGASEINVPIQIVNDSKSERIEYFNFELLSVSNSNNNVELGSVTRMQIIITDNDSSTTSGPRTRNTSKTVDVITQ